VFPTCKFSLDVDYSQGCSKEEMDLWVPIFYGVSLRDISIQWVLPFGRKSIRHDLYCQNAFKVKPHTSMLPSNKLQLNNMSD
jgi:hypothetical protein